MEGSSTLIQHIRILRLVRRFVCLLLFFDSFAGAGYVLDRKAFDFLLKNKEKLRYSEIDDVAVGRLLHAENNIPINPIMQGWHGISFFFFLNFKFLVCWLERPVHYTADFMFPHCSKKRKVGGA
jgi:hypothetical protein